MIIGVYLLEFHELVSCKNVHCIKDIQLNLIVYIFESMENHY